MNQHEPSQDDVQKFVRAVTEQRLDYLKLIKSMGYPVDDEQIAILEKELRGEETGRLRDPDGVLTENHLIELQRRLALIDLLHEGSSEAVKLLLLRLRYTMVRMNPDPNHQRAHFHIQYKKEHAASYAVDTLERLAGHMPTRYERPILESATRHKQSLMATWKKLTAGENVEQMIVVNGEA